MFAEPTEADFPYDDKFENKFDNKNVNKTSEDEFSFRPQNLTEFIGQQRIRDNLGVFIQAAKQRQESLDHVLLSGPPGLGKTTLAHIIAHEMDSAIRATSAPAIDKAGELAALLTALGERDVLFIDEIHRLPTQIEEILYPAMEDRQIDIIIGQGPTAKSIKLALKPFTLIGATTRPGMLSSPLTARFGIPLRMEYYQHNEMVDIVLRNARLLNIAVDNDAATEIAKRGRCTPRLVIRLLKRIRDFAQVNQEQTITLARTRQALTSLEIDELGLDHLDRKILQVIIQYYKGGPVGVKTIATAIGEDMDTIEDIYEPFLIQIGLLQRTQRGRIATHLAYDHIGLETDLDSQDQQPALF